jgi:hypothetical protein
MSDIWYYQKNPPENLLKILTFVNSGTISYFTQMVSITFFRWYSYLTGSWIVQFCLGKS